MRKIYFVTEGVTDQIVLEGLVEKWIGEEDFVPVMIQPPNSAFAEGMETVLSEGWRGVVSWCGSQDVNVQSSRDVVLEAADLLVVHVDADVARDVQFAAPPYAQPIPPSDPACRHVEGHLRGLFGAVDLARVVFCIPAQDLEAWVLCCLFPAIADANAPIEAHAQCAALLIENSRKLTRRKDGRIRKNTSSYRQSLSAIVAGWANCVGPPVVRCEEAVRFEAATRAVLA